MGGISKGIVGVGRGELRAVSRVGGISDMKFLSFVWGCGAVMPSSMGVAHVRGTTILIIFFLHKSRDAFMEM